MASRTGRGRLRNHWQSALVWRVNLSTDAPVGVALIQAHPDCPVSPLEGSYPHMVLPSSLARRQPCIPSGPRSSTVTTNPAWKPDLGTPRQLNAYISPQEGDSYIYIFLSHVCSLYYPQLSWKTFRETFEVSSRSCRATTSEESQNKISLTNKWVDRIVLRSQHRLQFQGRDVAVQGGSKNYLHQRQHENL